MTGRLVWDSPDQTDHRYDRVVIHVGSGKLIFHDQRKLHGIYLAETDDGIREVIGELGPDTLGLSRRRFEERLDGRRGGELKAVLMDQQVVAGLGNMLVDEVLWQAMIHPARKFDDLQPSERAELAHVLQRVLRASVRVETIPRRPTWLSSQRGLPEPACTRCDAPLETTRIGGRTSYWCPVCQAIPDLTRDPVMPEVLD